MAHPVSGYKPIEEVFRGVDEDAIDLLQRLLVFNPEKRLTACQALRHPYVSRYDFAFLFLCID